MQDGTVDVKMTLTSMGCPAGPMIVSQVEEAVAPSRASRTSKSRSCGRRRGTLR
ncbi:MAG: iron-sulfur cluster assembly protein [Chloroflexia bacterium]